MAPLLRRKLVCFYCGRTSSQRQDGSIREWLCKNCDAVNYLDESGEPTHPPARETPTQTRYALPRPRAASPELLPTHRSPYCDTCLTNQHVRKEILASYLPEDLSETDPQYKTFEAQYDSFVRDLDKRYPQVCADCEPRVREIMETRHKAVKADNVRRNMDRTKNRLYPRHNSLGWRELLVTIGALCYWLSIVVQLAWNLLGALFSESPVCELKGGWSIGLIRRGLSSSTARSQLLAICSALIAPRAHWGLALGLASLWWNPVLKRQISARGRRMIGLSEYYRLQVIVIVARFVVWGFLQEPEKFGLKESLQWPVHLFMLVLTVLSTFKSCRIVTLASGPEISWKESPESLLANPRQDGNQQSLSGPSVSQPVPRATTFSFSRSFPLDKILSKPPKPTYNPPTPPLEIGDDGDEMEWTPSQPQLSISQESQIYETSRQRQDSQGSFQGPSSSLFGRIDLTKDLPGQVTRETSCPIELMEDPPSPSRSAQGKGPRLYSPLRKAQFAPQTADTGLEDMFTSFFSLGAESEDAKRARRRAPQTNLKFNQHPQNSGKHFLGLLLLGSCLAAWHWGYLPGQVEVWSVCVMAVFSGLALIAAFSNTGPYLPLSSMFVFSAELVTSVALGMVRWGRDNTEPWDAIGKCVLAFMIAQEMSQLWEALQPHRPTSSPLHVPQPPKPSTKSQALPAPSDSSVSHHPTPLNALTFGDSKPALASPKLFTHLSVGPKPPSSSSYFDPHNPPTLTSRLHPRGADRNRLLAPAAGRRTRWGGGGVRDQWGLDVDSD